MCAAAAAPASDGGYKSGEAGSLEQPQSQDAATGRERRPTYITPPPSTLLLFAQQMEGRVGGGDCGSGGHMTVGGGKKWTSVINSYMVFVWPASSEDASRARTTSNWIL